MTNRTLQWLTFWCVYTGSIGALMVLGAYPPLDWPMRLLVDLVFWPLDGQPWPISREAKLLTGIGGAMLMAWSLILAWLFRRGFANGDRDALGIAQTSLWVWYVVDSVHSIAVGAPLNAVLNTAILAGFAIPLWLTRQASTAQPAE